MYFCPISSQNILPCNTIIFLFPVFNLDSPLEDIEDDFIVGDRVWVDGDKPAFVQFIGETKFTTGDLAGVVYDEPIGKHNGIVRGHEYFQCENNRGDFVRLHRLSRLPAPGFEQCDLHNSSSPDGLFEGDEFVRTRSHSDINKDVIVRRTHYRSPDGRRQVSKTVTSTTHSPVPHYALPRRPDRVYASRVAYIPARTPSPAKRSTSRARSATPSGRASRQEYFQTNLRVGERVCVNSTQGVLTGMLRYLGETSFGSGQWAGVELDSPFGKNDGTVQGRRYVHVMIH